MEHFYQQIGEDWFDYAEFYKEVVAKFPTGSHFVEVGSWRGRSASFMAVEILNSGKKIRLDCIDHWILGPENYAAHLFDFPIEFLDDRDWLYKQFLLNTSPVSEIVRPIRLESTTAASLYEDSSLDFVFIDATHEEADVNRDLDAWLPKVKSGGIISGHDYSWTGVKNPVNKRFRDSVRRKGECWIVDILAL
jgi:predicted O-methyltransferase YrrM